MTVAFTLQPNLPKEQLFEGCCLQAFILEPSGKTLGPSESWHSMSGQSVTEERGAVMINFLDQQFKHGPEILEFLLFGPDPMGEICFSSLPYYHWPCEFPGFWCLTPARISIVLQ